MKNWIMKLLSTLMALIHHVAPTLRHMSCCAVTVLVVVSCSPVTPERFYRETAMQTAPASARAGDLVGRWYDAWDWNGHRYSILREVYANGTGTEVGMIYWRTGGGMKTAADLKWSYAGNGAWNMVAENKRTLAGSGRFSSKPFAFHVRKIGGRIYDDTRKRTWVNASDTMAVSDKNLDMQWTGELRASRHQQIQELGQAMDDLRAAIR